MRRFSFFLLPGLVLAWAACTSQEVVVIKADAGSSDAGGTQAETDSGKVEQPPTGTKTDSGIAGQRLGDKGCKANEDCDSNVCFLAALEADNFCTLNCTPATAKEVCIEPLNGTCSRQLICDPAPE